MKLSVSSLRYTYNAKSIYSSSALQEVSFSTVPKEIIGLIGPNGSGKSTLLRCLAGVLPVGKEMIDHDFTDDDRLHGVGLVIQEPERQFFCDTVETEIVCAIPGATDAAEVCRVLKVVDYRGDRTASPFRLSGGEKRRVAIASILILKPALLLLDEPTVGLDGEGTKAIRGIVREQQAQGGTVIIASHDMEFLYTLADRFLVVNEGRLVADISNKQLAIRMDLLEQFGIEIPEAIRLLARKPPEWIRNYLQACAGNTFIKI